MTKMKRKKKKKKKKREKKRVKKKKMKKKKTMTPYLQSFDSIQFSSKSITKNLIFSKNALFYITSFRSS